MGPNEFLSRSKALVPQSHGCVDNIFSISTHYHKPERDKHKIKDMSSFKSLSCLEMHLGVSDGLTCRSDCAG